MKNNWIEKAALAAIIALLLATPLLANARAPRSHAAKADFQRQHPCPATSDRRGKCPGYVIDHVMPLCAGGPDHPSNMQWQTVADAKLKDRDERSMCRKSKHSPYATLSDFSPFTKEQP